MSLHLILGLAALIFGIIGVVESRGRNWAAWGVICLAIIALPFLR
jgi:hypothetical protein